MVKLGATSQKIVDQGAAAAAAASGGSAGAEESKAGEGGPDDADGGEEGGIERTESEAKLARDRGLPTGGTGKRTAEVMRLCSWIHENALVVARAHRRATGEVVYVSPSGFLQLTFIFKRLLKQKAKDLRGARDRYIAGIKRLEQTAMAVTTMSKQLQSLKPHLQ